eukprot:3656278-Rhodomonas_salina.1
MVLPGFCDQLQAFCKYAKHPLQSGSRVAGIWVELLRLENCLCVLLLRSVGVKSRCASWMGPRSVQGGLTRQVWPRVISGSPLEHGPRTRYR